MRPTTLQDAGWRRAIWPGVVVVAGAALTTWFTCITPFVAFGVIVAATLSRRDALALTVAGWLANQVVGYGVLHYPWTPSSVAWGVTIGVAALMATVTAQRVDGRLAVRHPFLRGVIAFAAAFTVYEVVLYAAAVSALGGVGAFAPPILGEVLLVNAATLVGLCGLHQLASITGLLRPRRAGVPVASATVA